MSEIMPPIPTPPATRPSFGRIFAGLSFTLGWVALHFVLFYVLAGGGLVLNVLLSLAKSIMFPGKNFTENLSFDAWSTPLAIGVISAGIAGVQAGIAIVWRNKRIKMMLLFWVLLFAGVAFELYALISFIAAAFSIES
jgi:hypothetical protein